jgi:hypothetical protein
VPSFLYCLIFIGSISLLVASPSTMQQQQVARDQEDELGRAKQSSRPQARTVQISVASPVFLEETLINDMDVLSGRNTTTWSHEGNRSFQRVVAHTLGAFLNATDKVSRNQIVSQVIATIHQRGGRFLKKIATTDQWEELPIEKVRAKVSHALRDRLDGETGRRKHRKVRAQQQRRGRYSGPPSSPTDSSVCSSLEGIVSDDGGSSKSSSTSYNTSCDHTHCGWWVDDNNKKKEEDEDSEFLEFIKTVFGADAPRTPPASGMLSFPKDPVALIASWNFGPPTAPMVHTTTTTTAAGFFSSSATEDINNPPLLEESEYVMTVNLTRPPIFSASTTHAEFFPSRKFPIILPFHHTTTPAFGVLEMSQDCTNQQYSFGRSIVS